MSFFKRMGKRSLQQIRDRETEHLTILEDTAKQLEASLRRYEPQRLGTYTKTDIVYSEMLAFLGYHQRRLGGDPLSSCSIVLLPPNLAPPLRR